MAREPIIVTVERHKLNLISCLNRKKMTPSLVSDFTPNTLIRRNVLVVQSRYETFVGLEWNAHARFKQRRRKRN